MHLEPSVVAVFIQRWYVIGLVRSVLYLHFNTIGIETNSWVNSLGIGKICQFQNVIQIYELMKKYANRWYNVSISNAASVQKFKEFTRKRAVE